MERESPWTAIAAWIGAVVVLMDVLFDSPSLRVADPAYRAAIRDVLGRIQATGRVTQIQSPLDPRFANQVSATRHAALLQFRITGSIGDSATRVVPVLAAAPPPVTRVAVHAPSVHNTQPWRFGRGERHIDVFADVGRRLRVADPDGRELMISCGAALFTLRVALRYLGWLPQARLFPDSSRPALVARVSWDEDRIAADPYEREMYAAVTARHTHRGGFGPAPLPAGTIAALREEAAREGAMLRLVAAEDQRGALAAMVQAGEHTLRLDNRRAAELADWVVAPDSPRRDGIPPAAYPAEPAHTEPDFPGRDFAAGKGWGLGAPAAGERSPGAVCLLATSVNEPADWVAAGQALQRVLLRAASCGVAAALHSQPLELPQLRDFIRVQLAARAHPQMIIRLGVTGQVGTSTGSIRRPVGEVLL